MKIVARDVAWGLLAVLVAPMLFLSWLGSKLQEWWFTHQRYRYYFGHWIGEYRDGYTLVEVQDETTHRQREIVMIWRET